MPQPKRAAALPKVTLGKLEEAMALVERMVDENTVTFVRNGQIYKDRHRDGTRRPLNVVETAQIAAGLGTTLQEAQAQLEEAGATAYDEPATNEVLLAAGVATGTAFLDTAKRLACLLEMPNEAFERACETDTLHAALDAATREWRSLDLTDARVRAGAAMSHFAAAAGFDSGKAVALAARAMWEGLWQAMRHLDASGSAFSTVSAESTGGAAATSSTTPAGVTSAT